MRVIDSDGDECGCEGEVQGNKILITKTCDYHRGVCDPFLPPRSEPLIIIEEYYDCDPKLSYKIGSGGSGGKPG